MSGRQGAGGFSITCNATREDKVTKKDSSLLMDLPRTVIIT